MVKPVLSLPPKNTTERFKPCGNFVLVKRLPQETKTHHGIELPTDAQDEQPRARVVACGPGRVLESGSRAPMDFRPGDLVYVGGPGSDVVLGGEKDFFVCDAKSIAGVIETMVSESKG